MFRDRLTGGQLAGIVDLAARRAGDHHQARSRRCCASEFNIGDLIILFNMVLWGVYSASLRWRPTIHPLELHVHVRADLRRRDAAGLRRGSIRPASCCSRRVLTFSAIALVTLFSHHRGLHVLDARRRADRPEPGRGVPAPDPDLQRAADRRAARRAAALLSRGRLRADPRRRVVRGAASRTRRAGAAAGQSTRFAPRPCRIVRIATAMPAQIRPYSIAVAPDSSLRKRLSRLEHQIPFRAGRSAVMRHEVFRGGQPER